MENLFLKLYKNNFAYSAVNRFLILFQDVTIMNSFIYRVKKKDEISREQSTLEKMFYIKIVVVV